MKSLSIKEHPLESTAANRAISEEDRLRAEIYNFLATYLTAKPDAVGVTAASALSGDDTEFGRAFSALARIAAETNEQEVGDEYDALFIGLARGELLPYASYYLTGFLNEKPLAKLRSDMQRLGIERHENVKDPEDHIGSLMEMMAGLISGRYGEPASIETQRNFFRAHIEPWAGHFFEDLEAAKSSRFYQPIGTIGRVFIEIEKSAFAME
jgi:TorA maturation chaperone TorD